MHCIVMTDEARQLSHIGAKTELQSIAAVLLTFTYQAPPGRDERLQVVSSMLFVGERNATAHFLLR